MKILQTNVKAIKIKNGIRIPDRMQYSEDGLCGFYGKERVLLMSLSEVQACFRKYPYRLSHFGNEKFSDYLHYVRQKMEEILVKHCYY